MKEQILQVTKQITSMQQPKKITESPFDYNKAIAFMQQIGINIFGSHFKINESDKPLIQKVLCCFVKDEYLAKQYQFDLDKGILLTGPVGCGKTTLMTLMQHYLFNQEYLYRVRSCRDVSYEFIQNGYETIWKYSKQSFQHHPTRAIAYCFDDLGTEQNLKYFGNECNVMAEVLLSRYDLFVSRGLITHLTTNLSATEIEQLYGNRVRSRMREMFNLVSFDTECIDKRK